jgi:drug/metabolite transporter (DMT)-like permease
VAEGPGHVERARVLAGLLLGIVAVSFGSILVRLAQAEAVPALSIAAWRMVFACSLLLPYAGARHAAELRSLTPRERWLLVASGAFLGLHFATWIASLAYTTVASSVVLVSTGPLFVGLGSWVFLRETPSRRLLAGLGVAVAGTLVISWGDFGGGRNALLGDLLALAGALAVAGYLMIGRRVRAQRSLVAYIAPVYGVAMLTLLAAAAAARSPMLGFPPVSYLWLVCLGLGPQLTGHSSLNWALRHLSATHVAMATLAEPIGACLLAWALLGELPSPLVALGGAVTLAGIWLATRE